MKTQSIQGMVNTEHFGLRRFFLQKNRIIGRSKKEQPDYLKKITGSI
uniref:Uncharacterized protein n=1 Tax=Arundo donax TaxID=35708 RepID=A0A0A8ZX80_ARUDO